MATITVSNTGGLYNATTTWVGGVVPTSADTVVATSTSGPLTINTTTAAAFDVNLNGYTNTLNLSTVGSVWSIYGTTFTLASGMTITGVNTVLFIKGPAASPISLTANGKIWTALYQNNANNVPTTWVDTWVVNGQLIIGTGTQTINTSVTCFGLLSNAAQVNGGTLYISGSYSQNALTTAGTTNFIFNGTGTINTTISNGPINNNVAINTSGTITFAALVSFGAITLTYTAGTIITTVSTVLFNTTTLNTSGINWNNINITGGLTVNSTLNTVNLSISATPTITLNADLYITGTYTAGNTNGGATFSGAYIVYCPSFNFFGGGSYIAGSSGATVVINRTGTITNASGGANTGFRISTTINHSGTTTINGLSLQGGFPFVRTAGSVTITGTVYMQNGTCTMTGFSGITIPNLTINGSGVGCTAIFDFTTISGTLTTVYGPIIQDASGFSVGTLTSSTSGIGANITLTASHTYMIKTAITINTTTSALRVGFVSSIPGTKAILILNQDATQDLGFVNATDIDSSGGQKILTYKGVLSNTSNWGVINPNGPTTIASVFG